MSKKIPKGLSFEGLRASKSGFLKPKCLESFFKNVLPTEGGEHIFETKCEKTEVATKMQAKWHLEACIFDANSHHDPPRTIILHFARRVPSEMKSTKINRAVIFGRPGGMRGGAGGRFEGG